MTVAYLGEGGVEGGRDVELLRRGVIPVEEALLGERRFELLRDMWSLTIELNFGEV